MLLLHVVPPPVSTDHFFASNRTDCVLSELTPHRQLTCYQLLVALPVNIALLVVGALIKILNKSGFRIVHSCCYTMFVYLVHAAPQIICGFVNASVAKDGYCGRCGFDFDSK